MEKTRWSGMEDQGVLPTTPAAAGRRPESLASAGGGGLPDPAERPEPRTLQLPRYTNFDEELSQTG